MAAAEKLSAVRPAGGHRTLAERAFATLHEAIVTGVLAPGERLPIEELAEVLEMSPMPIREALRLLDSVGLVENIPHRGARVTELSIDDLREVYEARLALEPLAVRHAAENFTDEDAQPRPERLAAHVKASKQRDLGRDLVDPHRVPLRPVRRRQLPLDVAPDPSAVGDQRALPVRDAAGAAEPRQAPARARADPPGLHRPRRRPPPRVELHNHLARTANMIATQMGGERAVRAAGRLGDRAGARVGRPRGSAGRPGRCGPLNLNYCG